MADAESAGVRRYTLHDDAELHLVFAATYRKEWAFVLDVVRRSGVPPEGAEDAAQDVFVVLHARLRELDPRISLRVWLSSVARHVSRNHRRARWRRQRWLVGGDAAEPDRHPARERDMPDVMLAMSELEHLLAVWLERLHDKKREVFVLTLLEQRTAAEIAQLTGVSPNTVSSRLRAARSDLARALQCSRGVRPAR